jgi:hypothetical protein
MIKRQFPTGLIRSSSLHSLDSMVNYCFHCSREDSQALATENSVGTRVRHDASGQGLPRPSEYLWQRKPYDTRLKTVSLNEMAN